MHYHNILISLTAVFILIAIIWYISVVLYKKSKTYQISEANRKIENPRDITIVVNADIKNAEFIHKPLKHPQHQPLDGYYTIRTNNGNNYQKVCENCNINLPVDSQNAVQQAGDSTTTTKQSNQNLVTFDGYIANTSHGTDHDDENND